MKKYRIVIVDVGFGSKKSSRNIDFDAPDDVVAQDRYAEVTGSCSEGDDIEPFGFSRTDGLFRIDQSEAPEVVTRIL